MTKTLIVGAGITGASVSHLLQEAKTKLKHSLDLLVWEKNNIIGGRMMSRSFRQQRDVHVDVGAQYLSTSTPSTTTSEVVIEDIRNLLRQKNLLIPLEEDKIHGLIKKTPSQKHEICPHRLGMRAIVEELLQDTNVELNKQLDRFEITFDGTNGKKQIRVFHKKTLHQEEEILVDNLIFTCPPPQLQTILQNSSLTTLNLLQNLDTIEHLSCCFSQRFALSFLFDLSSKEKNTITQQILDLQWIARHIDHQEDDHIRYLCWDHLKKQTNKHQFPSLLVHTSVSFGKANMEKKNKKDQDEMIETIKASIKKFIPFLPQEKEVLVHRWRISQAPSVTTNCTKFSTQKMVVLHTNPHILVAGDVFLGSKFDHCLLSAKETVEYLLLSQKD